MRKELTRTDSQAAPTAIAVLLAALLAPAGHTTTYVIPADADFLADTPLVLYGVVEYTMVVPGQSNTDAFVRVDRILKGSVSGSVVRVRQVGGNGTIVMGLPMLRKGDRTLLFLYPAEAGVYRPVDMGLGVFFEDREHLWRGVHEDGYRNTRAFSRWIVDRGDGIKREPDYLVDTIPGPVRVRSAYTLMESCEQVDREGNVLHSPGLIRWKQFDDDYSLYESDGYTAERNFTVDVSPDTGGWLTQAQALAAVNSAVNMWKGNGSRAFTGPTVSDPIVRWREPSTDRSHVWEAHIGVYLGVPEDEMGCSNVTSERRYNTSSARGQAVTFGENPEPLFSDDDKVIFYDEGGAVSHASTNKYKCSDATWDSITGTTAGNGDVFVKDPTDAQRTEAANRATLCTSRTDASGYYSPGSNVAAYKVPACSNKNVLGLAKINTVCSGAEGSTLHDIPNGDGQAYRADFGGIWIRNLSQYDPNTDHSVVSVLGHELGHTIGIAHSQKNALMHAVYTGHTTLQPDDVSAAAALYPKAPPSDDGSDSSGGTGDDGGPSVPVGNDVPGGSGGGDDGEPDPPPASEGESNPPLVPPVAFFTVNTPCTDGLCSARAGESVVFTDTSLGTVARRSWDFDTSGSRPSGKSVTHTWLSPGFYGATLTVDGAGADSTLSRMFRVDAASPAGSCVPGPETVCLQDSRYEVEVEWQDGDGAPHAARVVHAGTNDSGLFSFFDRDNWEMLVKVLNGCSINGHHWVYAASATDLGYVIRVTDTSTGESKEFRNEAGQVASAVVDAEAFSSDCAAPASPAGWSALAGGETLSLGDGRFEVGLEWSTAEDAGVARTVRRGTEDSGLFWFFEPSNWEVLVKVLDGCGVNGHHWVYAASATSLPFELSVTDTVTGEVYHYSRSEGELGGLADPAALSCAP